MSEEDKLTVVKTPEEVAKEVGFKYDPRFKVWAKKINGVNLTKEWGYALEGEFIDWNKAVAFENNAWLVLSGELGSKKDHSPTYILLRNQNGKFQQVKANRDELKDKLPPDVYAKARNSILYAYAVRIDYVMKQEGQSLEVKDEDRTKEELFEKVKHGEGFHVILSDGVSIIYGDDYAFDEFGFVVISVKEKEEPIAQIHKSRIKEVRVI